MKQFCYLCQNKNLLSGHRCCRLLHFIVLYEDEWLKGAGRTTSQVCQLWMRCLPVCKTEVEPPKQAPVELQQGLVDLAPLRLWWASGPGGGGKTSPRKMSCWCQDWCRSHRFQENLCPQRLFLASPARCCPILWRSGGKGCPTCMCEWCWGERRRPVRGDDPLVLNCQLHH